MPRRNKRKGHPQHGRGLKRPRGYHRKAWSPGVKKTTRFLDKWSSTTVRSGLLTLILATALIVAADAAASPAARSSIEAQIRAAFPDDPTVAVCIASAESTGTRRPAVAFNPLAVNGGHDGLFQIAGPTWNPARNPRALPIVGRVDWRRIFDPAVNIRVARRIYLYTRRTTTSRNGWLPWTTRRVCGR